MLTFDYLRRSRTAMQMLHSQFPNVGAIVFAITLATMESAYSAEMEILYNVNDGILSVAGPPDAEYSAVSMKLLSSPSGEPPSFFFNTGVARWEGDDVLDLPDAQGFVSFIGIGSDFTVSPGFEIGRLLPPQLAEDNIIQHVSVVFNQVGAAGSHNGAIRIVPEPSSYFMVLSSLVCVLLRLRYSR